MENQSIIYNKVDFDFILSKIRNLNDNIGNFELAVYNNEFSYSVKLSNGKVIIPEEVLQDREIIEERDIRLRMIAESFIPNEITLEVQETEKDKLVPIKKSSLKKHYKILFYFIPALIIGCILMYFIFIYQTRYEKGVSLIKHNKFNLALIEFNKIDSLNKYYSKSLSKIYFINGLDALNKKEYQSSLNFFKLVNDNDEFNSEVRLLIEELQKNPEIIYDNGMKYIQDRNYGSALKEFEKIKPEENLFPKAQNKISYLKAFQYVKEQNYENAAEFILGYDPSDELYEEVKILQEKINNYKDFEANKDYAISLINLANNIQDEWELSRGKSFADLNNVYTPQLVWQRSSVNSTINNAKVKDNEIKKLKNLIIKMANNYIKRCDNMFSYGRQTNYNNNLIDYYFGNEIEKNRTSGNEIHHQVIQSITAIKSKYNID